MSAEPAHQRCAKRVCRRQQQLSLGTDFGGLEAPRMALKDVGFDLRHMFTSETNKSCVKLSRYLYPDIETRYNDVADRDNSTAARVDLYVAGVPCTSWSACGLQLG